MSISSANLLQPISKITRKDIVRATFCDAGGFGTILVTEHKTLGKVALKRLIIPNNTHPNDALRRRTLQEAITWQGLSHPNVLPFLGVREEEGDRCLYLVSPFVQNGSLEAYLCKYPDVDRPRLLREAASAIAYLHQCGIIHGDIKASNILVSDDIHALLCDFGLARFEDTNTSIGQRGQGTSRFQSPEPMQLGQGKSPESDVWAFGMTIYQVLSGCVPFHEYTNTAAINIIVNKEQRPPRDPTHSSSGESYAWIWNVAEKCWQTLPADRPSMRDVLKQLRSRMTVLQGHTDVVRCLAFSPDSNTVASGSYDHSIRSWDVESGAQRGETLVGHTDWVECLAFSSDGRSITSGSIDHTVRFWHVESGTQMRQKAFGPAYWIQCLAFSPDGQTIASGANDRTIRMWQAKSGIQLGDSLLGHVDWVRCLAFSSNGKRIASGSYDQTVRLRDVETGMQQGEALTGHADWVRCLVFSPVGKIVVSGSKDHTIRLWDVESGSQRGSALIAHGDWIECLAFSPDGKTLASGSKDRTIRFWDVESGKESGNALRGHEDWVVCLAFSPDGKTLASGSSDHTIRLWVLDNN